MGSRMARTTRVRATRSKGWNAILSAMMLVSRMVVKGERHRSIYYCSLHVKCPFHTAISLLCGDCVGSLKRPGSCRTGIAEVLAGQTSRSWG